ncbi:uncharacterized protein PG998_015005 [Apiospora kogelbergensis]|uniref:uncharacterized protein n=1 Tax=Apiospora kogelbergensis TaxID=1337665 RepID=UPI003132036E
MSHAFRRPKPGKCLKSAASWPWFRYRNGIGSGTVDEHLKGVDEHSKAGASGVGEGCFGIFRVTPGYEYETALYPTK